MRADRPGTVWSVIAPRGGSSYAVMDAGWRCMVVPQSQEIVRDPLRSGARNLWAKRISPDLCRVSCTCLSIFCRASCANDNGAHSDTACSPMYVVCHAHVYLYLLWLIFNTFCIYHVYYISLVSIHMLFNALCSEPMGHDMGKSKKSSRYKPLLAAAAAGAVQD